MTYSRYSRNLAFLLITGSFILAAQEAPRTAGEKATPRKESPSLSAPGSTFSGDLKSMAKPQKATALVTDLDLKERSITIVPAKKDGKFKVASLDDKGRVWGWANQLILEFPVPAGLEKVKTSKRAAKVLGKKQLRLDEVTVGSRVKVEYYPVLMQIIEITVEQPGKGAS